MKILVISTDKTILDKNSPTRARAEEYARLFDEYHCVVYTPRGFKRETLGTGSVIYPTNSRSVFFRPFDAFRIGSKIIRSNGVDVVSVQDPAESGLAGWLLKKRFGLKLHIQVHSDFLSPFFRKSSSEDFIRYCLAIFILSRGDSFRVVSRRIKDSLMTVLNTPAFKIVLLPIFVDKKQIAVTPPSFSLNDKYPEFDFVILMVSRLVREKNISLALSAFRNSLKEFPKNGLVIVGDGPEFENLKLKTYELAINNNVRFEGWQDNLVPYYKTADLYLLTSDFEGYGRTVVEASAAGLPVVMTDVGVASEIIIDHDTGRVVPPRNEEALSIALREARYHYGDMRRMAQKADRLLAKIPPTTWNDYLKMYKDSLSI